MFLFICCVSCFSRCPFDALNKLSALREASSLHWFLTLAKVTPAWTTRRDITAAFPRLLTTEGHDSGNYIYMGCRKKPLAGLSSEGLEYGKRWEEFKSEVWMLLYTWENIWGEGSGWDKSVLGKMSLWLRLLVSYNLAQGQCLSLLWISASSSVQTLRFHDSLKFLIPSSTKGICIYIIWHVRKTKFLISPSLPKKEDSLKLGKSNIMKNSTLFLLFYDFFSWTGDVLSGIGHSPCLIRWFLGPLLTGIKPSSILRFLSQ